ncbi:hypothetical protein B0H67DRAFT_569213 [Lasiosphaeris hirsuta]|uniref:Uncharacterized protein n=1 Tax=Lasiosphaeris hirsuta TaxID=260670 RepID=A0AA40E2T4_9PEZI|nr:hypothetical protein B0H67DRAFT_569213 [Lasiosphaeris hirsuta]
MSLSKPIAALRLEPKHFHQVLFQRLHQQRGNRNPGHRRHQELMTIPDRHTWLLPQWDKALQSQSQRHVALNHTHHLSHRLGHRIHRHRLGSVLASRRAEVVDKVVNKLADLLVNAIGGVVVVVFSVGDERLDVPKEGQWHKPLVPEDCGSNLLVEMHVGVASARGWRLQSGRRAGTIAEASRQSGEVMSEGLGPGVGFWAAHGEACPLVTEQVCGCRCWLVMRPRARPIRTSRLP